MKQLLKNGLVMVVLFTTIESYSYANTFQTEEQTKNVTTVSIDSVVKGSLFMIKDSNGLLLYNEIIENTGTYSKNFDLTNLPDANYYFELDMREEIKIIPFIVKSNIAEFVKDAEYKIVKPEVVVRNEHVYISKVSLDEQSWEIEVYYEDDNDLAYSEKLKSIQNLTRVYDFSSSKKGNYTIVLISEDRIFRNSIQIQ